MDKNTQATEADKRSNEESQAVDKAPGEERGQAEQVTTEDLKGKKVDRDMTDEKDEPLDS